MLMLMRLILGSLWRRAHSIQMHHSIIVIGAPE